MILTKYDKQILFFLEKEFDCPCYLNMVNDKSILIYFYVFSNQVCTFIVNNMPCVAWPLLTCLSCACGILNCTSKYELLVKVAVSCQVESVQSQAWHVVLVTTTLQCMHGLKQHGFLVFCTSILLHSTKNCISFWTMGYFLYVCMY